MLPLARAHRVTVIDNPARGRLISRVNCRAGVRIKLDRPNMSLAVSVYPWAITARHARDAFLLIRKREKRARYTLERATPAERRSIDNYGN